jgi:transcriptional regulator with XRE-family HTH domain
MHVDVSEETLEEPTVEDTDATGDVDVGQRLRTVRQRKRHTLKMVADRAGISQSFLSQVERGRAATSIATLKRIAAALEISMGELFEPDMFTRPRVLKVADRPSLAFGTLGRKFLLTSRTMQHLEVFAGELLPGGSTGDAPYAHGDSEEVFLVTAGRVVLEVGESRLPLGEGDCVEYHSSQPHRVTNPHEDVAEVLWIISPPSY